MQETQRVVQAPCTNIPTGTHVGVEWDVQVVPQLLVDLINSSFGQKQVEICKSAQATKQTELGIKNAKKILFPLPELSLQNEISAVVQEKKQQIRALQSNAEKLRQYAKKEFEKAVFGLI